MNQQHDESLFEPEPIISAGQERDALASRHQLAVTMLKHIHESLGHVIDVLSTGRSSADASRTLLDLVSTKQSLAKSAQEMSGARVLEGVFDGLSMVGADGQIYTVPPNYASKSRLVEGDILKLTIKSDGMHIFKQIAPVERRRIVGTLGQEDVVDQFVVTTADGVYNVLAASISFFKAVPGDEVVLLVPASGKSRCGAVESVMKHL